jgi:hypothetical protein
MCSTRGREPSTPAGDGSAAGVTGAEVKLGSGGAGEADLGVVDGTGVLGGIGVFVGSAMAGTRVRFGDA